MARSPLSPISDSDDDAVGLYHGPVTDDPPVEVLIEVEAEADPFENIAHDIDQQQLDRIGQEVVAFYQADLASQDEAEEDFEKGLDALGLTLNVIDDGPFEGASTANYPILLEAMIQFWARAMPELFPPAGPVKTKVHGRKTKKKQARAERVANYMNYQCLTEDEEFYDQKSDLIWKLPFFGSMFSVTRWDPLLDQLKADTRTRFQVVVNARSATLQAAGRATVIDPMDVNDVRRRQKLSDWLDFELPVESEEATSTQEKTDEQDRRQPDSRSEDDRRIILSQYVDLDLPGFEHEDEHGEPTGIKLPYIVIVDKGTEKVLSIARNWKPDDDLQRPIQRITHYKFLPGFGFYGLSLIQALGRLAQGATGILRLMIDGTASASLSGGFLTANSKLQDERVIREPGVWKQVNATYKQLQQSFFSPPVKEPSGALVTLLGLLVEAGQRVTSATEVMTGEANNNAPVGTTVALIEQGLKVFSAIHRGLHMSAAKEFRTRYMLNGIYVPVEGYKYDIDADDDGEADTDTVKIFAEDFAPGTIVEPVSDPNIVSSTQRIAVAQAGRQIAIETPHLVDGKEATRRMLDALNMPDVDKLMPMDDEAPRRDAVSENQCLLLGKPIRAFADQDHASHIALHLGFMSSPGFGGNPEVQKFIDTAMRSHIAEHLAHQYAAAAVSLGIPAIPVGEEDDEERVELDPVIETQISVLAAQRVQELMQAPGLPQMPDPAAVKARQTEAEHQQKLRHSDEEHEQKMAQKVDEATLSTKEREAKMLDEAADRDLVRDMQKADKVREMVRGED